MGNQKNNFGAYLIESFIVAFGVFLGFYVSEWNSQKRNFENIEKSIRYITDEISGNITKIENSLDYQSKLILKIDSMKNLLNKDDLDRIYYKSEIFRINKIQNFKGLQFPNLENIMFESSKINGVFQDMNITTAQKITSLYKKQDSFIDFTEKVENKLLNLSSESKVVDVVGLVELLKYDGINFEKSLLDDLKSTKINLENIINVGSYKQ